MYTYYVVGLFCCQAMDLFTLAERDPSSGVSSLKYGLRKLQMPILVMGVRSDLLFPLEQQVEIKDTLKEIGNKFVSFYVLDSIYGHDTFLIDIHNVGAAIKGHLEQTFSTEGPLTDEEAPGGSQEDMQGGGPKVGRKRGPSQGTHDIPQWFPPRGSSQQHQHGGP